MQDRFARLALSVALILAAAFVFQPYVDRILFSGTPRPVEARGDLAEAERTAVEIFDQASPSVVHVVARRAAPRATGPDEEGVQSGTGFLWDTSRHVVTNSHVVAGTNEVAVRFGTGGIVPAKPVGVAER